MSAPDPRPSDRSERLFALLMRLYPRSFRDLYETDSCELFRDRLGEARRTGGLAVALLWARTVPNLLLHGPLERLADLGRTEASPDRGASLFGAVRRLLRSPGLSAIIVLTLGLGIGANVALYGVLRGVLLRPLPFPESDRLVHLWETNPDLDDERHGPSPWNFHDWTLEADAFESMTAWYLTSGTYRTETALEEVRSAQVTVDFFRTLGVAPALGRDFRPEEVLRYGPVMLSHRAWQRLFAGDPDVVGRTVITSGQTYEIVGVMPPDFTFPDESVETWIAWNLPAVYEGNAESRTWRFLDGMGRLKPGVSVQAAEEELDAIAAGLAEAYPGMNRGWDAAVTSLHEDIVGDVRGTLWVAFGSVLFILLIACVNVANLLLARVPARAREVGIRTTLGASRERIAGELLVEHGLLGVVSGVLGLGLGQLFIEGLVALDAGRIPRLAEVSIDPAVFGFTALVAVATTLAFGAAPMVQLLREGGASAAARGTRSAGGVGQTRLRYLFVGSQISVALVLLTGAGLFATSLTRLTSVDPGLDPDNVATFRVSLDPSEGGAVAIVRYYDQLIERLEATPGVLAAGASQTTPMNPVANDFRRPYRGLGTGVQSADAPTVQMRIVTPGYPAAMGMRLLSGTTLPDDAVAGDPLVAVINQTLARRLFPSGDAVGRTFEIDFRQGWQPYRVVGVVQDVRHYGLRNEVQPEVFLSHAQSPYLAMTLVARTLEEPETMFDELRATVLSQVPTQPPHNFVSLESLVADSTAEERFLSVLLSVFATIAVLLAGTGVYGVISYSVVHRRREIGVRMALGAEPGGVVREVLVHAIAVAGVGLLVGFAAVALIGGIVESLLFETGALDPGIIVGVAFALGAIAVVAAWLPARRAAWIQPSEALRAE